MSRLSIIIPAVSSIESLESTLVSVLQHRPYDSEILVILNQEYADPYALAGEVEFVQAPRRASTGACVQLGLERANSPVVHILASGCEVKEAWADPAVRHFLRPDVVAVSPLIYDRLAREQLLAHGIRYGIGGSRKLVLAKSIDQANRLVQSPLLCAGFYRRTAVLALGGIEPQLGELADIDLGLMFRAQRAQVLVEGLSAVYAPLQLVKPQPSFKYGIAAERLFWRNAREFGWMRSLPMHVATVLADSARGIRGPGCVTQLVGRLVGAVQFSSHAAHQAKLETLRTKPAAVKESSPTLLRVDGAHHRAQPTERSTAARKAG